MERNSKIFNGQAAQNHGDVALPQDEPKSQFRCFYPASNPTITDIQALKGPPKNVAEALTHAVAYLDLGFLINQSESQSYDDLKKQHIAAKEQIGKDRKKLEALHQETVSQHCRIAELEVLVVARENVIKKLQPRTKDEAETQQGTTALEQDLVQARKKLSELTSHSKGKIRRLEEEIIKEKDTVARVNGENRALEVKVSGRDKIILTLQKELATKSAQLNDAKHHIDIDGHIIAGIQDERDELKRVLKGKERELTQMKVEHEKMKQSYKTIEEEKRLFEEKHKNCPPIVPPGQIEEESNPSATDLITLQDPTALVGHIQKAPETVDDHFFTLDVPFSVSLYNHTSSKLYVSDNGTIGLDKEKQPEMYTHEKCLHYKDGQRLPVKTSDFPQYCILPLWTDLNIIKGEGHGIFYKFEGESGQQTLTIQWFVTRYNEPQQYFQFDVVIEEARPNVVTYKYHNVADSGEKGTVGVQGLNNSQMYSHDEKKLFPGLQLVFDTSNSDMPNKPVVVSRFKD